jgi:epoxyqueuosine reductase QueG
MSEAEDIIEKALTLFDVMGVARDPDTSDTVIVLGLVTTPERDLDDFVKDGVHSIMRGFERHARHREDKLLEFISGRGYEAELVGELGYSPSGRPNLKHLAVAAGLGKQGKNTVVISPDYGPWLRFMAIRTNAPLPLTGPGEYAMEENPDCAGCQRCVDACPVGIILPYRVVDTGKCLAAITEDRRGELAICEDCVVACPVGRRKPRVP